MPKNVTETWLDPNHGDIAYVNIIPDGQGGATSEVSYRIRRQSDNKVVHDSRIFIPLTGPQLSTVLNYLDNVVIPAIKDAEGMT